MFQTLVLFLVIVLVFSNRSREKGRYERRRSEVIGLLPRRHRHYRLEPRLRLRMLRILLQRGAQRAQRLLPASEPRVGQPKMSMRVRINRLDRDGATGGLRPRFSPVT